jgi:hypothetical protein
MAVAPRGPDVPVGKIARSPAAVPPVTVRFVTTARAVTGIPHVDASWKARAPPAVSAGPPADPFGLRVSTERQGVTG